MKKIFRSIKWLVICLFFFLLIGVGLVYLISELQFRKHYKIKDSGLKISQEAFSAKNGERLFIARGCSFCHGENLGGKILINHPLLGILAGRNLTKGKGGLPLDYGDEDYVKAIRHGIGRDEIGFIYMPSDEFYFLNDNDLGDIIAYIKSVPEVNSDIPSSTAGFLMRFMYLMGKAPIFTAKLIDHDAVRPETVKAGETIEYGRYLSKSCMGCHGNGLSGGEVPAAPPNTPLAANITPDKVSGIGNWSKEDFIKSMREGIRPDGSQIDPFMPWQNFRHMTDIEIGAIWAFIHSKPPKSFGNH